MRVGGDADAMRGLAARLDDAAVRLIDACRQLAAVAPADGSMPMLARIADWAADRARDIRRRAALLEDPDEARRWALAGRIEASSYDPDPGIWAHGRRVSKATLSGLWGSVTAPVRGAVRIAEVSSRVETLPFAMVGAAWSGGATKAGDELASAVRDEAATAVDAAAGAADGVRQSVMSGPVVQGAVFAERAHRDGFWRAAEDSAYDQGAAFTGTILSLAPGAELGSGATRVVSGQLVSAGTGASALGGVHGGQGASAAVAGDASVLELGVGVPGHREVVAYDYRNGDFLVAHQDADGSVTKVERHRWSRLEDRQRRALRDHGVVDAKGHPQSPSQ